MLGHLNCAHGLIARLGNGMICRLPVCWFDAALRQKTTVLELPAKLTAWPSNYT
jgi:hypothetical protein